MIGKFGIQFRFLVLDIWHMNMLFEGMRNLQAEGAVGYVISLSLVFVACSVHYVDVYLKDMTLCTLAKEAVLVFSDRVKNNGPIVNFLQNYQNIYHKEMFNKLIFKYSSKSFSIENVPRI